MTNNLVIFAFTGLGGHHLANLLAIGGHFHYPVDYTQYFSSPVANAHYGMDTPVERTIAVYHFGSADDQKIADLCCRASTKFVVIHFPSSNQLAKLRIQSTNGIDLANLDTSELVYDLEKIYKQQFLEKIYPGQWWTVMADDLFSQDVNRIVISIESILMDQLNLEQKDHISAIHRQWINKLTKNPYPYYPNHKPY